ncbi:RNA polymerase sigma factor [Cerasicoccus arenae]|uniref:RNA polymerase sigma factor n=1 Tax=Cerasicoccus arenae TaxID=424488 RepID=UPI001678E176|nr:sigma-70 family RNA polymerase sigma factor [Cerasicoccus arenae]MBK1857758.1 sigma-70 family RNA polymerase sigma factor [Cerasicoccus arenae]
MDWQKPLNEAIGGEANRERSICEAIDKFGHALNAYLFSKTQDWHEAENISQELWISVHEKFTIEQMGSYGLLRCRANQLFIDHYRKRKVRSFVETRDEVPEAVTKFDDYIDDEWSQELFWETFEDLDFTEDEKAIFWLWARHNYTYAEIGNRQHMPTSTVADKVAKVRRLCKEYLQKQEETE